MALALNLALLAPLIVLGGSAGWLLLTEAEHETSALVAGCPASVTYTFRFGNEGIDNLLCGIVLFFKTALEVNHGVWICGYLLSVAVSSFAFMAVEASRYGNSWLLSLTPVYAFLFQLCGISVVVPVLWLPVYILTNAGNGSRRSLVSKAVSPQRVACIKFMFLFIEFISLAMLVPTSRLNKDLVIFLFQFAPIVAPIFWLPVVTTRDTDPTSGHRAIVVLHALQAGGALLWQLAGILMVLEDPGIPFKAIDLLLGHHSGKDWCAYFLLVDGLVLFIALVYAACMEDGIIVALSVLLGAPLVGPGAALSLYYVYREEKLLNASKSSVSKNKKL